MFYLLILAIGLMAAGLGGVLVMVARKIPTLAKLPAASEPVPTDSWSQRFWLRLKEIRYSTYRPTVLNWLEKNLRRFRILILKIDNLFIAWIAKAREKSQVWTVRSRAWVEHRRLKKREKSQVLEKLDKVEVSEGLEKIKEEMAQEEDEALLEKIEAVNGKTAPPETKEEASVLPENIAPAVSEEEKKYIDLITQNPKDTEAYRVLGYIYLKQKNYSDARACFRQVLKLKPEDEEIKNKLEEIKGLKGRKNQINSLPM